MARDMFQEYDTFILQKSIAGENVPIGTRGVVLIVYDETPRQYEVEFPDSQGGNIGGAVTYTISDEFMKPEVML